MSEELKPCPFCGGVDVKLRQHLATNMSWVSCTECGLEAPSETGWTDDISIEYWNTRSDAAKDAEIEKLKAELAATYEELIDHTGDDLNDTRARRVAALKGDAA